MYQKPKILERFSASLKAQNHNTIRVDYMFVDDNVDNQSKEMLNAFSADYLSVHIIYGDEIGEYTCNDETHYWNDSLMLKVREDGYWNVHSIYRPFLIRYQPNFPYKYNEMPQPCGGFT